MRPALVLVLLAACKRGGTDFGTKPHLLRDFDGLDLHQTRDDKVWTWKEDDITYAVDLDDDGSVNRASVVVDGTVDDVIAAWGPGEPGPGHWYYYFDGMTRYDVFEPLRLDHAVGIEARLLRPFASVLDGTPDVKLFGVEILNRPIADVKADLDRQRTHLKADTAPAAGGAYNLSPMIATELGDINLSVFVAGDGVARWYEMGVNEVVSGRPWDALVVRLDDKWGTPEIRKVIEGVEGRRYPSQHPSVDVTVGRHGVDIKVEP